MRILVTGASGLLGLNLALQAAEKHQVTGVVNTANLKTDAFNLRQVNLLSPGALQALVADEKPEWIIHCAALANVDDCQDDPVLAGKLNADLPGEIAQLAAQTGARMVHISTDAVFDGQRGDYTEEDVPNPLSVYARTKLAGEQAVLEANPKAIVARVNFYGWSLSGDRSLAEFFYNNLSSGKQMNGFQDVKFCPLLANHLADALLLMLGRELSGLYHVVGPECLTKYEFGRRLAACFGFDPDLISPVPVAEAGLKAPRSPNLTLRVGKLTRDLGEPLPGIDAGIEQLFELYQQGYPKKLKALQTTNN